MSRSSRLNYSSAAARHHHYRSLLRFNLYYVTTYISACTYKIKIEIKRAWQGLCLPQSCQAAPIEQMLQQLDGLDGHACPNLTIASYLDKCVEPSYEKHCNGTAASCKRGYMETKQAVNKAWTLLVSLNKKNRGPIKFQCGDHKLEELGTG